MRAQRPFDPQLLWRTGQEEGKLGWPRPLSEIPRVRSLIWDWPDKGAPTNIVTPYIWALPVWAGGSKRLPRWFGALIKRRTIQPFRMVKYGPKKVPQSARYLGNAQM